MWIQCLMFLYQTISADSGVKYPGTCVLTSEITSEVIIKVVDKKENV